MSNNFIFELSKDFPISNALTGTGSPKFRLGLYNSSLEPTLMLFGRDLSWFKTLSCFNLDLLTYSLLRLT